MQNFLEIDDPRYPSMLKESPDAPKKLYFKGVWRSEMFENTLAVVGSRRMSVYGRRVTQKLVRDLASHRITIVSGFMFGVDAVAHQAALDVGGLTIAVMPCGIDKIHPEYQAQLYNQILEKEGLVLSEYEGLFGPQMWTFPQRNRIVAGISTAVLITEATMDSGSLITARLAQKLKRPVLCVPGNIDSSLSEGTLTLIKNGAQIVTSADDVLNVFGIKRSAAFSKILPTFNDASEKEIMSLLEKCPSDIDEISKSLELDPREVSTKVTLMELTGLISQEGGKFYVN